MLCPDRRSLIIARDGECVANSVVFSLRRVFNYCWYVAKEKKNRNESRTKREQTDRQAGRLKTEQKDNSSMRKQSKIESCTHKVPLPVAMPVPQPQQRVP